MPAPDTRQGAQDAASGLLEDFPQLCASNGSQAISRTQFPHLCLPDAFRGSFSVFVVK